MYELIIKLFNKLINYLEADAKREWQRDDDDRPAGFVHAQRSVYC